MHKKLSKLIPELENYDLTGKPVNCFYLDFRALILNRKLNDIEKGKINSGNSYKWDKLDLGIFLQNLHQVHGEDIEDMRHIMHMIDALFDDVSWIMRYEFYFFVVFSIVPFLLQMVYVRSYWGVIFCNVICLITKGIFLSLEYIQMRYYGFKKYALDSGTKNKIDLLYLVVSIWYHTQRLGIPTEEIIPDLFKESVYNS